jgi:N-acetylglucosamine-6-phosphate deacetylase
MVFIHNTTLYTPAGKFDHGAILISGETITALGYESELSCPANIEIINAKGQSLVPGFIDLQINGAFGMDFSSNPEFIWQVGKLLPRFGVTSFLPTIVSSPSERVQKAQAVIRNGPPNDYHGARVIGLHLEGPYLNPKKHGAHNLTHLHLPEPDEYEHWSPANCVRMVTLAPELPGAIPAIETLIKHGVVVSVGHSLADPDQADAGIEAGIRYATHLFNAMPSFDHQQPGLVGALLTDRRMICGMIVDGNHLHPVTVNLAWQILGSQRTSLVTDAMAGLGMAAGEYQLAGSKVHVDGSCARLEAGTLAGSLLSLDQALRNLIAFTGCSLSDAIPSVTQVPARLLRLESSLGSLSVGNKADLVLLNPDLEVTGVWLNGRSIIPAPV